MFIQSFLYKCNLSFGQTERKYEMYFLGFCHSLHAKIINKQQMQTTECFFIVESLKDKMFLL